jgi:carbon-monoxide dehydrogenase large subunit
MTAIPSIDEAGRPIAEKYRPTQRHWVGMPMKRKEDVRIIRGRARYVDDITLSEMVHCKILRSPYAHARIKGIDVSRAKAAEGVICVLTGAEASKLSKPWNITSSVSERNTNERCLAVEKVRYVGEPVAAVVAIDKYLAEDALDLIDVEYEPLPPIVNLIKAMEDTTSLVHEEWGTNIQATLRVSAGDLDKAFREADFVIEDRFETQRTTGIPMETSGTIASYDELTNSLTVWSSTQNPFRLRTMLAQSLSFPEGSIRCIAPDVGGGYGIKDAVFTHEIIVPLLAIKLGVPVKYIEDRREHLIATRHGYHHICNVKVAVKKDGTILGWKERVVQDGGAYPVYGIGTVAIPYAIHSGAYKIPTVLIEGYEVCTNKASLGAYRGLSDPQKNFVLEVMMDKIAKKLGMDRAEFRLKNMIKNDELPYTIATGAVLDSGSFEQCFRKVLEMIDYEGVRKRNDPNVGVGFAVGIHYTATRWRQLSRPDSAIVRVEPTGTITVLASNVPQGQGHDTTYAQVVADEFAVDMDRIMFIHGDTDKCPRGVGTMASRGAGLTAGAIAIACRQVKAKMVKIAGHLLEANEDDLEFRDGHIMVKGTDSGISFEEVANVAWNAGRRLPEGMPSGLQSMYTYEPINIGKFDENGIGNASAAYGNGADAVVVKVDPETGDCRILKYVVAHDCGVMINPLLVEGQIQGGLCQGIGIAMYEDLVYDENGQPLASLLADYTCPTAVEMPMVTSENMASFESPSPNTPLGTKGVGEISIIHPPAIIANAITDAVKGEAITELPLSLERVYNYLRNERLLRSSE